jgi:23S rRNA pseudouridine1911/1915/1917 synthase
MSPPRQRKYVAGNDDSGLRLDLFLTRRDLSLSRSQIRRLIDGGHVRAGMLPARASHRLKAGETVTVEAPAAAAYDVMPQDIPLSVIYEDESILVVDKPAGMVVHPAAGHARNTLVNAILFHCRDLSGIGGVLRPGIVHRLDKDTSGLLVVAKSDRAHQALTDQFRSREVQKTYQALVHGNLTADRGLVELPVGRHPVDRKKMSTRSRRGRDAVTHWRVCERYGAATFLELDIETGRTHQIRVHLNALGHPVVGDGVYGGTKKTRTVENPVARAAMQVMKRQALHAARLRFAHPIRGDAMAFTSSLPADMAALCESLKCSR